MRIGIDIKCLRYNHSGIGRYLSSLLNSLQQIDKANDYFLFSPNVIQYPITNTHFHLCPYYGRFAFQKNLPGVLWQQITLPQLLKKHNIDIFWGPEQTLPLGLSCCKKILTIHDFVYERYPETMQKTVRWINKHIGEKSIKVAHIIAVNSEFTKTELLHFHPDIDENKIKVVPCGISGNTMPLSPDQQKKGLLFVGNLEPRKNIGNLIKALEILHQKGISLPLTVVGPKGWKNNSESTLLQESTISRNIRHIGFVNDEELKNLYINSAALVFPSLYEGFGIPVLESLNYGTPVLTTKGSVMEEIVQGCGMYFDARSPESIAHTIESFLGVQKIFLQDKEDKRLAIIEKYQWKKSAESLLKVFEQLDHSHDEVSV